jgi:hypothetical protein
MDPGLSAVAAAQAGSPRTILVSIPDICLAPAGMFRFTTHHNEFPRTWQLISATCS